MKPAPAAAEFRLADGVVALAPGFALFERSRTLVCADAHFGYEDVVGGALPLWSTAELLTTISIAAQRHAAREIVFLGDAIHGSRMSEGAARTVGAAFDALRALARVTCIAGNHEGRSRGTAILGATVEQHRCDGWLLLHGDRTPPLGVRTMIGHLHPSLHLDGGASTRCFIAGRDLVVVPALTPYSRGLNVLSDETLAALAPWNVRAADLQVVAATDERVYPFGSLAALRSALAGGVSRAAARPFRRRVLRADR